MGEINNGAFGKDFLCFLFIFPFLFGNKIGYFDLSIFVPLIILIVIRDNVRKFDKKFVISAIMIAVLLTYQIFLQLIWHVSDIDSILRLSRALIACFIVAAFANTTLFSAHQIIRVLFYALLIHSIVVVVAALVEPINIALAYFSDNQRVLPSRASGLLAGYDIAGLFCVIGSLMLSFKIYLPRNNFIYTIFQIIFGVGCFFTSRISIALFLLFFIPINFLSLANSKVSILFKFVVFSISFVAIGFIFWKYIAPIVDVTFSLNLISVDDDLFSKITASNAVQSSNEFLWADMFFLPSGVLNSIFGTGTEALQSDVGYIKDIFRYGFIGVFYSIFIYGYLYHHAKKALKLKRWKNYLKFLAIIFFLIFFMTFKNNYIFTRGIFSLILLIVYVSFISIKRASSFDDMKLSNI